MNPQQKLVNKVAVVTGASKGIGAAVAKALAAEGAAVVVNYASDAAGAARVVGDIEAAGGSAVALAGNVADEADVGRMWREIDRRFGKVDVVVNNAGVFAFAPLSELSVADFHRQFDTNVLGLLLTTKAALPLLSAGASVINISSVVSDFAPPGSSIYAATKGAVDTITKVLAKELAGKKIRVNAVSPGLTITEGTKSAGMAGGAFEQQMVAMTPLGRAGAVADIAAPVVFLASDDAGWITGEIVCAAGGAAM